MPTFRLLQARHDGDPVREEEAEAFAARLCIPRSDILVHDLLNATMDVDALTDGVDAVLVGGSGKFSIYDPEPWLSPFIDGLGELCARQFPTFASCFGFQGLVMALGGEVRRDEPNAEVGTFVLEVTGDATDDPLFGGFPERFHAQLGHKDRAFTMPSEAAVLARSPRCPYQAMRVGRWIYATQFHPELTALDNRTRFQRYFDDYSQVFGPDEAHEMLDSFVASPEADALLLRFKDLVAAGTP